MPIEIITDRGSMSLIGLIANASVLVQLVMLILLLASVVSWFMIDRKRTSYKRLTKIADQFEDQFWSGGEMNHIYNDWSGQSDDQGHGKNKGKQRANPKASSTYSSPATTNTTACTANQASAAPTWWTACTARCGWR